MGFALVATVVIPGMIWAPLGMGSMVIWMIAGLVHFFKNIDRGVS